MTRVPMGVTMQQGPGIPFGPRMIERYDHGLVPQGLSAEMIAEKWGLTREQLDGYAVDSHARATRATEEGRFENEILPIEAKNDDGTVELARQAGAIVGQATFENYAQQRNAALDFLAGLRADRVVPLECDYPLADTLFKEGSAAFIINGPWSWQSYKDVGLDIGLALIPRVSETRVSGIPSSSAIRCTSNSS